MSDDIVRVFEVFGSRFEVTAEFDKYNMIRSEQARDSYTLTVNYDNAVKQTEVDFKNIYEQFLQEFSTLVNNKINSALEIATVGFAELQRCKNEVLPRIGKRLIFKHTKNELISVEEVASHIQFDAMKHFSGFVKEIQQSEDKKQNYLISKEYERLTRSNPMVGGIGFGASGMAGVVAGTLAANAGIGILRGIGDMVGQGISNLIASKEMAKSVVNGRQALLGALNDMATQVYSYCLGALQKEFDKEIAALGFGVELYKQLSEERSSDIRTRFENYSKAYKNGDITPEKYASYLFNIIRDIPHNHIFYCCLYQVASNINDTSAQETIMDFTKYLGLDGYIERWVISKKL